MNVNEAVEDGVQIPEGLLEMITQTGIFSWLIALLAVVLFVMFIVALKKRESRFSFVFLASSFMPFIVGMMGTYYNMAEGFGRLAISPMASSFDLVYVSYMSLFSNLFGMTLSVLAVFLACLLLAFSRELQND